MTLRRLFIAAAIFHVVVTLLLFVAGRMQLAPHLLDRDGILAATSDSVMYQQDALRPGAWRDATERFHVRLLAPFFRAFAPFRAGILAAEPLNLFCYLAIVGLTFAIGRETFDQRSGLVAAGVVALWPTFVLHTTQLLKDPLFIAATLALVVVIVSWLTTTYDWSRVVAAVVVLVAAAALLYRLRWQFGIVVLAIVVFGLVLLVARQLFERRLLLRNLASAAVALGAGLLIASQADRTLVKVKPYPSPVRGESKMVAGTGKHVTPLVVWVAHADRTGTTIGGIRARYNLSDAGARSPIDEQVELRSASDVVAYLPRAIAIGFWAPFPDMWLTRGQNVGQAGRALAGAETAMMYVFELFAVLAIALPPRRLPALLLFGIAAIGVTALGMVVSNVGTLYRFRYSFWILLIITGVAGAEKLAHRFRGRAAVVPVVACILALLASCSHAARPDVILTNLTGTQVDALYLSPADASTWEENVLGGDVLRDGDTVEIRFASPSRPRLWDLRAEGGGLRAEWKALDTGRIRRITLRGRRGAAVAELSAN
ncbi:MAG TPA: hypothetical protein VGR95_14380 [Thermoanaerobaculia bacterium]|nr:hypothetical protein [Thermoanaerobaculia bacterium]